MASEKQIAANRANAKRSTGPKTAAGKQKSSRNAFLHGLSRLVLPGSSALAKADATTMAAAPADGQAAENQLEIATSFAEAQLELSLIRAVRTEQWGKINLDEGLECNWKDLRRLAALDRYDRYALTKLRRASKELRSEG